MLVVEQRLNLLFLCTGNSCRSQMAEGWVRSLKGDLIDVYSAGIEKHGLNARAVLIMGEAGVDIANQQSNTVEELGPIELDVVVTVLWSRRRELPNVSWNPKRGSCWL